MYESADKESKGQERLALSSHLNMKMHVDNFFLYMPEFRPVSHQTMSQEVGSGNLETVLSGRTHHRLLGLFVLVQMDEKLSSRQLKMTSCSFSSSQKIFTKNCCHKM